MKTSFASEILISLSGRQMALSSHERQPPQSPQPVLVQLQRTRPQHHQRAPSQAQSQDQENEHEQQAKKPLLGRPYWKRAVNRGRRRSRKDQGITGERNNLGGEEADYDSYDPASEAMTLQHERSCRLNQNDHNIHSHVAQNQNLPLNHPMNHPMNHPINHPTNHDFESNEDYENIDMLHNTLGLSLDMQQKDAVASVERVLIHIGLLMAAYSLGVYAPGAHQLVRRMAEYLAVAWLTCRIILIMSHWNYRRTKQSLELSSVEQLPRRHPVRRPTRLMDDDDDDDDVETDDDDDDGGLDGENGLQTQAPLLPLLRSPTPQPHPALEHLFIMDTSNGRRFVPNSTEPFILDNAIFQGRMLTLVRTPDVDNPHDATLKGTAQHSQLFVPHFTQRQRRFEFQWQLRLKQKVRLYFRLNRIDMYIWIYSHHKSYRVCAVCARMPIPYITFNSLFMFSPTTSPTAESFSLANWRNPSKWESSSAPLSGSPWLLSRK